MSFNVDRLYNLLPAIHRIRDTQQGGPLKALLAVIAEQAAVIEEDLAQLEDDQFIETCAEWVVPYIGDLIGTRGVHDLPSVPSLSRRAQVANTLGHRRRKGTASVMEQLARDVTQWEARAVEFFQLLATTQAMNHLRLGNQSFVSVRHAGRLQWLNTPFERLPRVADLTHNADVRRIGSVSGGGAGRYNIPNIGIFLWRLRAYALTNVPAMQAAPGQRRFFFNPLGRDTPLFNFPQPESDVTHLAQPVNVPMAITRRMMHDDLAQYYGRGRSVVITVNDADVPIEDIRVCNLSDQPDGTWGHQPQTRFAIDPELGRFVLPLQFGLIPGNVQVSFHYGFSADMGGGQYDRAASITLSDNDGPPADNLIRVPEDLVSIQSALTNAAPTGTVEITDSDQYAGALMVQIDEGGRIILRAADGARPVLDLAGDDLTILGGDNTEVILDGLVIMDGALRVPAQDDNGVTNQLRRLRLNHCTLVPGRRLNPDGTPQQPDLPSVIVQSPDTIVQFDRCIVGGLRVVEGAQTQLSRSIVDATSDDTIAYAGLDGADPGGVLRLENCTIVGKVHTRIMELASNTIFLSRLAAADSWTAPVRAQQVQQGCVRFSYRPLNARLPRCYQCQPEGPTTAIRVRPQFTSLRFGDPGYGQLTRTTAVEIHQGADDESEMGVFHDLYQPQRLTNLRVRLEEYTRFAMETGVFLVT